MKLEYFADYTASLDALAAGQVDVNAQTLNDTIFAVSSGAPDSLLQNSIASFHETESTGSRLASGLRPFTLRRGTVVNVLGLAPITFSYCP